MTREDQKVFIAELCKNLAEEITEKIDSGAIPENWEGIEIRQYAADSVAWYKMDKRRARDYRNAILITGSL